MSALASVVPETAEASSAEYWESGRESFRDEGLPPDTPEDLMIWTFGACIAEFGILMGAGAGFL